MPGRFLLTGPEFEEAFRLSWEAHEDPGLQALLDRMPLTMLLQFDAWVRHHDPQVPASFRALTADALDPGRTPWMRDVPGLVCVLACHRDGTIRRAALPLLARLDTPLALGLLLVRMNDWAVPVREQARALLRSHVLQVPLTQWLQVFPLLARLAQEVRSPDPALVRAVVELFLTADGQRTLKAQYVSLPPEVRRSLVHQLLNHDGVPLTLLLLFAHDPLAVIRRTVLPHLPVTALTPFLADRDGTVRVLALRRLLPTLTPVQAEQQARVALLDPQERVRLLGQYILNTRQQDVRAAYLRVDPTTLTAPELCGWIAGLASCGQAQDAALLDLFFSHPSSSVRLETLHAAGMLDPVEYRFALAAGVLDTSPVSRMAVRSMQRSGLLDSPGMLEHLFVRAATERQKRRVIRLVLNLSRFGAVSLLLRWRAGQASDMTGEIDPLLVSLLDGFGHTYFTRPSAGVLDGWRQAVERFPAEEDIKLSRILAMF